MHNVRHD